MENERLLQETFLAAAHIREWARGVSEGSIVFGHSAAHLTARHMGT